MRARLGPRSRKRRGSRARVCGAWSCTSRGALEPPVSVAEAVSSLTIADAFVAVGETVAPLPAACPSRRFICSFPDCSASYNKAWKLDAHLCKHTGEVTGLQAEGAAATTVQPRAQGCRRLRCCDTWSRWHPGLKFWKELGKCLRMS